MKKKRKRSAIRKSQEIILRAADQLQKSTGIDFSRRHMFVGGSRPKSVQRERNKRDSK